MSANTVLSMKFETAAGKSAIVNIQPCKPDVTETVVSSAMDAMIASGVFVKDFSGKLGASLVERTVTELF
ncbi:MAG: DUF2922 domain-containing protein [Synergistaceae bacterium]|jgi:hypothetical protein|nr:DUF2922 domain-containing protein [Synergistaceae bacterium]